MKALFVLASKDLRILAREPWSLFWVLGFPLVLALLFGFLYRGMAEGPKARAIRIAVVDEDGTDASARFAARLERAEELRVERIPLDAARDRVRRGSLSAYVVLKPGFGAASGLFRGVSPALAVGVDPARGAEKGFLQGILMREAVGAMQERFADPAALRAEVRLARAALRPGAGLEPAEREALGRFLDALDRFLGEAGGGVVRGMPRWEAASIETEPVAPAAVTRPRSSFEISFPQAILWAIMGCASFFAVSLAAERSQGTLLRLRFSPLGRARILAGKSVACLAACAAVQLMAVAFGRLVFGVRVPSPAGLLAAAAAVAAGFTGLMMLVAALGRTEQVTGALASSVFVLSAMIGGGAVPLMFMPPWLQTLSHVSPVRWGILALEGAVWRDFGPGEMAVPCGVLLGFGLAGYALGLVLSRRLDRV
jgi:ABC-2 type transport system permease protein